MVFVLSSWISVHLSMVLDVKAELLITQQMSKIEPKEKKKGEKSQKKGNKQNENKILHFTEASSSSRKDKAEMMIMLS